MASDVAPSTDTHSRAADSPSTAPSRRRRLPSFHAAKLNFTDARQATIKSLFLRTQEEIDVALFSDSPATPERWLYLKSWRRFLPDGTVLVVLRTPLGIIIAIQILYAVAVCCYFQFLVPRGAPAWPGDVWKGGTAPIAIVNLVSFALALMIVHRIQTVSGRWWEARAAWGQIFNACRNVARVLAAWLDAGEAAATAERWTTALPLIARHHLRRHGVDRSRADLITALTTAETDWLLITAGHHTPTAAASVLERLVCTQTLPHELVAAATAELNVYINAVGSCERIRGTNQPLAITRLTSRLLQAWLALLPWCLWPACKWFTILFHGTLSFMLMSIENIAAQIEEPLGRLPLVMYAAALADDVRHIWHVANGAAAVAAGQPNPVVEARNGDGEKAVA
jgi:predicted membrane chloride channel (bestrophin family)